MLMLIMLPMWMNFLLRTYAWMTLLEKNGLINKFFGLFGLGPFNMINTSGAVVLGATALRIWQVRRKAKRDAAPAADAESQPSAPAPGPGAEPSPATVALGDPGSAREPGSGEPHD